MNWLYLVDMAKVFPVAYVYLKKWNKIELRDYFVKIFARGINSFHLYEIENTKNYS